MHECFACTVACRPQSSEESIGSPGTGAADSYGCFVTNTHKIKINGSLVFKYYFFFHVHWCMYIFVSVLDSLGLELQAVLSRDSNSGPQHMEQMFLTTGISYQPRNFIIWL